MKNKIKEFFISLIGRRMMFAFIALIEKWAVFVLIQAGFNLSWEFVAFFVCKDIMILALIGLVEFEKIQLKASVGG
jgi:hypothetical protein